MDIQCPKCGVAMAWQDNETVRCPAHGEFKIQADHSDTAESTDQGVPAPPVIADAGVDAVPEVPPYSVGVPSIETAAPPPFSQVRPGGRCVQHPNVPATRQCRLCGALMCSTCDFQLPDQTHICPACAAAPRGALSKKRRRNLIWSFVLAGWATVGMACLIAGAFAGMAETRGDQALLGWVLILFVLGPAIAGLAQGVAAKSRQGANPPAVWIAIIWNALLVGSFLLLTLIGIMAK